jgi:hypothetical protein
VPLAPDKRPKMGNAISVEVVVKPGEEIIVDFDIDTGIR